MAGAARNKEFHYTATTAANPSPSNTDADYKSGYHFAFLNRRAGLVDIWPELENSDTSPLPGNVADRHRVFSDDAVDSSEEYATSFLARSQEIVFLRAANSNWEADPNEQQPEILYFGDHPTEPELYPWRTVSPLDVAEELDERILEEGDSVEAAHIHVRNTMFDHDQLGVLRMTEYWPHWRRDNNAHGDPTANLDVDEKHLPVFIPRDRGAGVPGNVRFIDTLSSPGAWISRTPDNLFEVQVRWETMVPEHNVRTINLGGGGNNERIRVQQLRVFSYAVIPSPLDNGTGRLVRCYSVDFNAEENGSRIYEDKGEGNGVGNWISRYTAANVDRAMVIDKVLSDNVARVVFDTYRTDTRESGSRLATNEIRVRLYMAKKVGSKFETIITETLDASLSMRTANNARSTLLNNQVLGTLGVGLKH